jgi:hypothetical protein
MGHFEFLEAFERKREISLVTVALLTAQTMEIVVMGHEAVQSVSVLTLQRILPPSSDSTALHFSGESILLNVPYFHSAMLNICRH